MVDPAREEKIIFIDGGKVEHHVGNEIVKMADGLVLMPDFARTLSLPRDCKMHRRDRDRTVFVIENRPNIHEVRWDYIDDAWWDDLVSRDCLEPYGLTEEDRERRIFNLSFPYIVFVVQVDGRAISGVKVFFRDGPIRTASDYLYLPVLTGCNKDTADMRTPLPEWRANSTPATITEELVAMFWRNGFDDYLPELFIGCQAAIPELRTVWDWEFHSRTNQLWVLGAKWQHFEHTVGTLVDNLVGEGMSRDRNRRVYEQFVRNIEVGDDGRPSRSDDDEHVESPSFSVLFNQGPVRIGDVLIARDDQDCGVRCRVEYTVVHFYEPNGHGRRYAKLEGIDRPAYLGGNDLQHFVVKKPEQRSRANSFEVDGFEVTVGCRVIVENDRDLPYLRVGHQYRIREIVIDRQGDAKVVLSDYDTRVYITYDGGKLLPSLRLVRPEIVDDTFRYESASISVGDYITVHRAESRSIHGKVLHVNKLWQEDGKPGVFYISFEGLSGKYVLCSSSEMKIVSDEVNIEISDERIHWQRSQITVGQVIRIDSSVRRGLVARVARMEKKTGMGAHPLDYNVYFDGIDEPMSLISESQWQLRYSDVVAEVTDEEIRFADHHLGLAGLECVLARRHDLAVPFLSVHEVKAVRPSTKDGAHPFDMEMTLKGVSGAIPIIDKSQWCFNGFYGVGTRYQIHGVLNIKTGDKLQVEKDGVGGAMTGDVYEALYFTDSPDCPGVTEIVFTDGQGMPICAGTLSCFARSQRGGKFSAFSERQLKALPKAEAASGGTFKNGDQVAVHGSRWTFDGRLGTIIDSSGDNSLHVEFKAVPGHDATRLHIARHHIKHVSVEHKLVRRFSPEGEEQMLCRHDGSLIPLPSELEIPADKGVLVGDDTHGKPIHVGDVVIALRHSSSSPASKHNAVGSPAVVVHDGATGHWMYIDFGQDVGGGGFDDGIHGYRTLPRKYKGANKRKQVTLINLRDCEVCTIVDGAGFVDSDSGQPILRYPSGREIPMPAGLIGQLEEGSSICRDMYGQLVQEGSFVAVRRYSNCQGGAYFNIDKVALVVSSTGSMSDTKLHLYFAEPVEHSFSNSSCSNCRRSLNSDFSDRLDQTALTNPEYCEVLEVVRPSSSATGAEDTRFKQGDVIRYRSGIGEPKFGWGGTERRDLGVVTNISSSGVLTSDFGRQSGFRVHRNDVELAGFTEGTRLQLREGCRVIGGSVEPNETGRAEEVHSDGEIMIRFERSGMRIAPANRLQLVEESTSSSGEYQPRVGDRVKIRPDLRQFRYGLGPLEDNRDEIGEVIRVLSGGECQVRFPSHNGWHAGPGELVLADQPSAVRFSNFDRVRLKPGVEPRLMARGRLTNDDIGSVMYHNEDDNTVQIRFRAEEMYEAHPDDIERVPFVIGDQVRFRSGVTPRHGQGRIEDGAIGRVEDISRVDTPRVNFDERHASWGCDVRDIEIVRPTFAVGNRVRFKPKIERHWSDAENVSDDEIGVVTSIDSDDGDLVVEFPSEEYTPCHPDDLELIDASARPTVEEGTRVRLRDSDGDRYGIDSGAIGTVDDFNDDEIEVIFTEGDTIEVNIYDLEVLAFIPGDRVRFRDGVDPRFGRQSGVARTAVGRVVGLSDSAGEVSVNFGETAPAWRCHVDDIELVRPEFTVGNRVRFKPNIGIQYDSEGVEPDEIGTVADIDYANDIVVNFPSQEEVTCHPDDLEIIDASMEPTVGIGARVRLRQDDSRVRLLYQGIDSDAIGTVLEVNGAMIAVNFPSDAQAEVDMANVEVLPIIPGDRVRYRADLDRVRYGQADIADGHIGRVVDIDDEDSECVEVYFDASHADWNCHVGDLEVVNPEFAIGNQVRHKPNLGTYYDSGEIAPEVGMVVDIDQDGDLEVDFPSEHGMICKPGDVELVEDDPDDEITVTDDGE